MGQSLVDLHVDVVNSLCMHNFLPCCRKGSTYAWWLRSKTLVLEGV